LTLPAEIYTVENVRRIDQIAINDAGIGGYTLMTRAAQALLDAAQAKFPDARRWQIICGGGNNGGDGYVLARLAGQQGIAVSVICLVDPESLSGDAATAYMDFAAEGGGMAMWEGTLDAEADLLVDSLLGSGLQRDVEGAYADVVEAINAHPGAVVAVDIPTGLHGDTGAVQGSAVKADLTVTFVGLKSGLFLGAAPEHVGELRFADLDIAADCRAKIPTDMRRVSNSIVAAALPRRNRQAHKGDFGHLLVIGGGPGMPGAVRLCGEAALRSGAGRVSIATHPDHHAQIAAGRPELMCYAVEKLADIGRLLESVNAIAIGPGLGTGDWSRELFDTALKSELPLVLDADALNLLAQLVRHDDHWILTPHPGEAARLLDCSTVDVQRDRRKAVNDLQQKYGGTAVLKGSGSLISSVAGPAWLCTAGNPGMAAPGMGDVLTGIIAAFVAQGLPAELAAVAGVEVHARAGDAAARSGERGLLASELLQELRACVNP